MQYWFEDFVLDLRTFELRKNGLLLPAEPQVLSLLSLLIENRDRLVTKDELVSAIWNDRAVSDSAISSRIKSARQIIGDDGDSQRLIRTVHGRGFRFVGEVRPNADGGSRSTAGPAAWDSDKPSIAILPFQSGTDHQLAIISEGLPHELIVELSRLRWLTVIARASSFRFRGWDGDLAQVRDTLGVRYCLTGTVHCVGQRLAVAVELVDTSRGAIVWGELFEGPLDGIQEVRERILARVIASLEVQIPSHEAVQARLCSPDDLTAWACYHLGLMHMFRFNRADNAIALGHFTRAAELQPDFARAHAGVSFARFQNAFLNYSDRVGEEAALARRAAEKAVELDELDPFASLTLGRSHWLEADVESSTPWLERAIALSPNYAHAIYSQAWAQMMLCQPAEGQKNAREAMRLSPIDPLRYAMVATEAVTHAMLGDDATAAELADRAAREPRAHVLIAAIAAGCQYLAGNRAAADHWAADIRSRTPGLTQDDFFRSFPFGDRALKARLSGALSKLGI